VPISPFVEAPQLKKLPASSQKSRERSPSRKAASALATGLPRAATAGLSSAAAP
jgi:hypothetical protein